MVNFILGLLRDVEYCTLRGYGRFVMDLYPLEGIS